MLRGTVREIGGARNKERRWRESERREIKRAPER